jgi:hypothetical protein
METKDIITLSIAALALVVSIAAATYTRRQYNLNLERDQREQAKLVEDRTPFIVIRHLRSGRKAREWELTFTVQNKDYARAQVKSVGADASSGFTLALAELNPSRPPDNGFIATPVVMAHSQLSLNPNVGPMDPRGQTSFYVHLFLNDAKPMPADEVVKISIGIRLLDNADTDLTVLKQVKLD